MSGKIERAIAEQMEQAMPTMAACTQAGSIAPPPTARAG